MNEKQYLDRMYKEIEAVLGECVEIRKELEKLPKGCLSKKKINGKVYYYMQLRVGTKIDTRFVHQNQVMEIKKQVSLRDKKREELKQFEDFAQKMAKSSKAFDPDFYQELLDLLDDYRMDLLSKEERKAVLNEAKALGQCEWSEEKLSQTDTIDQKWIDGEISHKEWRKEIMKDCAK